MDWVFMLRRTQTSYAFMQRTRGTSFADVLPEWRAFVRTL
jgi:hypothetical protein